MKLRKAGAFLPAIVCMIVIFSFSATPAEQSSEMSDGISMKIVNIINEIPLINWDESTKMEVAEALHFPIRKVAHMSEFALLGILVAYPMEAYEKNRKIVFLIALAVAMLYAGSDEWHQTYVPGRDGNLGDVCIDSLGASIGIFLELYIRKKWQEKRT